MWVSSSSWSYCVLNTPSYDSAETMKNQNSVTSHTLLCSLPVGLGSESSTLELLKPYSIMSQGHSATDTGTGQNYFLYMYCVHE